MTISCRKISFLRRNNKNTSESCPTPLDFFITGLPAVRPATLGNLMSSPSLSPPPACRQRRQAGGGERVVVVPVYSQGRALRAQPWALKIGWGYGDFAP